MDHCLVSTSVPKIQLDDAVNAMSAQLQLVVSGHRRSERHKACSPSSVNKFLR